jgi:hypothetical protein
MALSKPEDGIHVPAELGAEAGVDALAGWEADGIPAQHGVVVTAWHLV